MNPRILNLILLLLTSFLLSSCAQNLLECAGPPLNETALQNFKQGARGFGPQASLVIPNPLDATNSLFAFADSPSLTGFLSTFNLGGLSSATRLENNFLKVRRSHFIENAQVYSGANFDFAVDSVEYSETMAYFAVNNLMRYVETLGFPIDRSRELYVLVRSPEVYEGEVNALYEHNSLDPSRPRVIHLVGDTEFAPSIDRDMYWHEFGHMINESVTFDRGFDEAGTFGATFTEGAALHECLADYVAESVGNKHHIGRWIARNFSDIPDGAPLRSAIDTNSDSSFDFQTRLFNDGGQNVPERYQVAEICSRVLWEIRDQFVQADPVLGPLYADRLIFSAMGALPKDASLRNFQAALTQADESLHCGLNQRGITSAFSARGIDAKPKALAEPLQFLISPIGGEFFEDSDGELQWRETPLGQADVIFFQLQVHNPNDTIAHNVRAKVDSLTARYIPELYQQGLGDLAPGQTIVIGRNQGLDVYHYGVSMIVDPGFLPGGNIRFSVFAENGGLSSLERAIE